MRKVITMMAICLLAIGSISAATYNQADIAVTATATVTTNTVTTFQGREWCELESIHIAFPPSSTSSVAFYAVSDNGVNIWQIGDTITKTNADTNNVTTFHGSYFPMKKVEFVTDAGITNSVVVKYPISGLVRCVITKTGTASQSFRSLIFIKNP